MLPRSAAVNGGGKVPRGNGRNKRYNVLLCRIVRNGFMLRKCKDTSHSALGVHGWVNLWPLGMVVKL
jgi:hypothetical protein